MESKCVCVCVYILLQQVKHWESILLIFTVFCTIASVAMGEHIKLYEYNTDIIKQGIIER